MPTLEALLAPIAEYLIELPAAFALVSFLVALALWADALSCG